MHDVYVHVSVWMLMCVYAWREGASYSRLKVLIVFACMVTVGTPDGKSISAYSS